MIIDYESNNLIQIRFVFASSNGLLALYTELRQTAVY